MPEQQAAVATARRHRYRVPTLRVFSSATDAMRLRRPTDVLLVLLAVVVLVALSFAAPGPTAIDTTLTELLHELGGFWDWAWDVAYALLALWPALLVLLALATRGRRRLLLDLLLAEALAVALALVVGRIAGTSWSSSLGGVTSTGPPQVYVAARLALATALVVTASPHLSRPFRSVGRFVLTVGAISGVALGIAYPIGALAGFAVGVVAGAAAHLVLGSPGGGLTADEVAGTLGDLGLDIDVVTAAAFQTPGSSLFAAHEVDGRDLLVRVYGRDAWDNQFLASMWTALVRRGERPHLGRSRQGQVEHEAVVTLLARQAGVPVPVVVIVGETPEGDAVLVTEDAGTPLADVARDQIDSGQLASAWRALTALHEAGIAHGRIDRERILVTRSGAIVLSDLAVAEMNATRDDQSTDLARMLVATAAAAGHERAVSSAVEVLGTQGLSEVLPYLQPAVLDRATRKAVKDGDWDLKQLRELAVTAAGVDPPVLERLRRVTLKSAAIAVGATFLAFLVVGKLLDVDWSSLWTELQDAEWGWLLAALLVSPLVQVAYSFSTLGASPKELRYGPVLLLQYAIQFLAVALPSTAARLALEVRFFERFGLAPAGALSIGVIDSVSGLCVQIVLILLISLTSLPGLTAPISTGSSQSTSDSSTSSTSSWLVLIAILLGLLVLAALVTVIVPRLRARSLAILRRGRTMILSQRESAREALTVLRRPIKVAEMLVGNFGAQVLQAIMLGLCLKAFGSHASLSQLILVNTLVSLFAGLMPVPGGVGVAEAGYIAGLQAVGVPSTIAISTSLAFRVVSFYLPPLWGSVSMGWLRRHQYV